MMSLVAESTREIQEKAQESYGTNYISGAAPWCSNVTREFPFSPIAPWAEM